MAATALPRFEPAALARFLADASGAEQVEIGEPALLPGGAIMENWGFAARFAGGRLAGTHDLVLRTDAPTGIAASLGRIAEFAVLRSVYAAGVTVPEPLFACARADVIGQPFFVMRRVAGTAQGRQITADPALEPTLPRVARRLARELARIQRIRPPHPDLGFLRFVGPTEHIAAARAYLDRHPNPRPALEWAIRWLATHIPDPLPPVLCHRDFRTGNYMLAPSPPSPASGGGKLGEPSPAGGGGWGLTGILDWEFAGWGDPDEDIGWLCCKGWRFARLDRELGGIAVRAPFYEAYEEASGRRIDPRRVYFWEVLANVRWATIALQQSDRCLIGGARDLATAIIGRRASECDLELLMLLDPSGCPHPDPPPRAGEGRAGVIAGDTAAVRDLPSGNNLLALGRELLLGELLPLLPAERERDARLVATAMAIAEREAAAGDDPSREVAARLAALYSAGDASLRRFAADLRAGAFEACTRRATAACALLWRMTMLKLREGNPGFLAANGFGE